MLIEAMAFLAAGLFLGWLAAYIDYRTKKAKLIDTVNKWGRPAD